MKARASEELKRKGLSLPRLDSVEAAKEWLRLIGQALAEDRLKPQKASELRRIAAAYVAVDPGDRLQDQIDELNERLENGQG